MTNEKIIHTVATVHNFVEKFVLYQKHNRTYVHTEKTYYIQRKPGPNFLHLLKKELLKNEVPFGI